MEKIILDLYGADCGAQTLARGAAEALHGDKTLRLVLVGDERLVRAELADCDPARWECLHTTRYVTNHDKPTEILHEKDDTSLVMALRRLKQDPECGGLLCAGNTGALLVGAIFLLGLQSGLKQPALATALNLAGEKYVCLVDCGATLECRPKELERFALMGDAFMRCMGGLEAPRVGLLSVGREPGKGTDTTREAYARLSELPIRFVGNIEGGDVCADAADVVVCDGFAGNVLLKNIEATGKLAVSLLSRWGADTVPEGLRQRLYHYFDFNSRGGAVFLGTAKPVIKLHGAAGAQTVISALAQMQRLLAAGFSQRLAEACAGFDLH